MIYEYGVKDGYGIVHWASDEWEALRWMGMDYPDDPLSTGIEIVKRVKGEN